MRVAGDVRDRVEGSNSVERSLGKDQLGEVVTNERRLRDVLLRKLDLRLRDVDAKNLESLREQACRWDTGATAKIED